MECLCSLITNWFIDLWGSRSVKLCILIGSGVDFQSKAGLKHILL